MQRTLGLTVFMVTHDLDSLYAICDRVAVLGQGRVIAIGPISELLHSEDPWIKAYFHGKRRGAKPPRRRRKLEPTGGSGTNSRDGAGGSASMASAREICYASGGRAAAAWVRRAPDGGRRRTKAIGEMETRANFVLIGAFTLAVIAGAFLFVLWFSGLTRTADHKTYAVLFTGSVSGLSRGSAVLFNGIRVGEVTQIDFVADDPRRVEALVQVAGRVPINQDTKARLEVQGLTGGAAIALTGGAPDSPPLARKDGKPPVIVAESSEMQNILQACRRSRPRPTRCWPKSTS